MSDARLVLRHGRVWTPGGFIDDASVVIVGERIAEIGPAVAHPPAGAEVVDVAGLTVLPGLIDTHSHHREPGFTHKEDIESATRAAAAGGVTLSIGMPNVDPPVTTPERYLALLDRYAERALVDFNVHPAATDRASLRGLAAAGCLGFKLYMVVDTKRSYPHMPGLGVHDDGELLEIFEAMRETERPLLVHPHNQELMTVIEKRYWERGERGPLAYAEAQRAYDGLVWDTAIQTLLRLQEATSARLHVLHLVTTRSVAMVRAAKQAGREVTSEVNPFALFLGDRDLIEKKGPYVLGRWVPQDAKEALWAGLRDGTVDVIGTDHAPHTRDEKEVGWTDMWRSPSGTPQLQDYFGELLTRVRAGIIDLDTAVRITSYNPARVFDLYPKKGTIEVGSDADIVVVDLDRAHTIRHGDAYSKCGWTPYDGNTVTGLPIHTLVRGRFVMRERQIVGRPGYGVVARPVTARNTQERTA